MSARSRRSSLPEPLAGSVRSELARLGGGEHPAALSDLAAVWRRSMGDAIAQNAWPARLARDGTLIVHVSSSSWAFELTQLESTVRERLGAAAPLRFRFVVGALPSAGLDSVANVERKRVEVESADRAEAGEIARGIADPALRELVARAAAASLAQARSRAASPDRSDTIGRA